MAAALAGFKAQEKNAGHIAPHRDFGDAGVGPETSDEGGNMIHLRIAMALTAVVPAAWYPAHAVEEAAPTDAHLAVATVLANVLNDANQINRQLDRFLTSFTEQAFATDPGLVVVRQEYPGVEKIFIETMRPIMRDELVRKMPEYRSETAAFFARNFTSAELRELLTFWQSPAGQTVLQETTEQADFSAITKEVVDQINDDKLQISGAAIDADKRKAAAGGIRSLSSEHRAAIIRFGLTPTGRKMRRLLPEKNQLDLKWANSEPSPETVARIEREIPEALGAFIEAEDRKRGRGR